MAVLLLPLLGSQGPERLGHRHEALAVLSDVIGRAALVGDVAGNSRRIDHLDGVPGAPALAQGAADAALQVNVAERLQAGLVVAGYFVDAIDWADLDTGLAAGAVVGVDDREFLGQLFSSL